MRFQNRKLHTHNGPKVSSWPPNSQIEIAEVIKSIVNEFSLEPLNELLSRVKSESQKEWASQILGEHYRLLKAIVKSTSSKKIVEVGSFTGLSASIFLEYADRVTCFDIKNWDFYENTALSHQDFEGEKLDWIISDIAIEENFEAVKEVFVDADLIFLDGPKDGIFEKTVLSYFNKINWEKKTIICLDDIYFKSMKSTWESITYPKVDFSLLGHASGTGLAFPYLA